MNIVVTLSDGVFKIDNEMIKEDQQDMNKESQ